MPAPNKRLTAFVVAMAVLIVTPLAVVASDEFTDVSNSNVHHDDITWLADAGVTLGCNPPTNDNFCPGDPVLRQQMASFLRRLAENQVVDAATAVTAGDADTVDGMHASELTSRIDGWSRDGESGGNTVSVTDPTALFTMPVTPGNGAFLMTQYGYYANGDARFFVWLQSNDEVCAVGGGLPGSLYFQEPAAGELGTVNGSIALATSGVTSLTLCADTFGAVTTDVRDAHLVAMYAPEGSVALEVAGSGGSTPGPDVTP
jgi:hypothetical protein